MSLLQKCDDPPCPHCGCEDTESVRFVTRWKVTADDAAEFVRQRCNHCGSTFIVRDEEEENSNGQVTGFAAAAVEEVPAVTPPERTVYQMVRCPEFDGGCGSTNTKVTSTQRPVRYHKCRDCGKNFKSVEGE